VLSKTMRSLVRQTVALFRVLKLIINLCVSRRVYTHSRRTKPNNRQIDGVESTEVSRLSAEAKKTASMARSCAVLCLEKKDSSLIVPFKLVYACVYWRKDSISS